MALLIENEERILADVDTVWAALNDPETLRACIPGCQRLDALSPTEMSGAVTLKIGPMKASFDGAVTLEDLDPPNSYTIRGEGKGGVAGFAKGAAQVQLVAAEPEVTLLRYSVRADIGGKLAQLGNRLLGATATKLSAEFFANFSERVHARASSG